MTRLIFLNFAKCVAFFRKKRAQIAPRSLPGPQNRRFRGPGTSEKLAMCENAAKCQIHRHGQCFGRGLGDPFAVLRRRKCTSEPEIFAPLVREARTDRFLVIWVALLEPGRHHFHHKIVAFLEVRFLLDFRFNIGRGRRHGRAPWEA